MASHTLQLNKGSRSLAHGVLHIHDQFKALKDLHTAITLVPILVLPDKPGGKEGDEQAWADELAPVEVTEVQRDLLKSICTNQSARLPVNAYTLLLLTELGLP